MRKKKLMEIVGKRIKRISGDISNFYQIKVIIK